MTNQMPADQAAKRMQRIVIRNTVDFAAMMSAALFGIYTESVSVAVIATVTVAVYGCWCFYDGRTS